MAGGDSCQSPRAKVKHRFPVSLLLVIALLLPVIVTGGDLNPSSDPRLVPPFGVIKTDVPGSEARRHILALIFNAKIALRSEKSQLSDRMLRFSRRCQEIFPNGKDVHYIEKDAPTGKGGKYNHKKITI